MAVSRCRRRRSSRARLPRRGPARLESLFEQAVRRWRCLGAQRWGAVTPGSGCRTEDLVLAAGDPTGMAQLGLVGHGVGERLDGVCAVDRVPVQVEFAVQIDEREPTGAAEQGETDRAQRSPGEQHDVGWECGEGGATVGSGTTPALDEHGPELLANAAQIADEGATFGRCVGEALIDSVEPREQRCSTLEHLSTAVAPRHRDPNRVMARGAGLLMHERLQDRSADERCPKTELGEHDPRPPSSQRGRTTKSEWSLHYCSRFSHSPPHQLADPLRRIDVESVQGCRRR